ncbi:hypothetical protein FQN60_007680, partial [Etheostoma spectabile]
MECTTDLGAAQVLSDTMPTSTQCHYPAAINPASRQPSSLHSVMFHHVSFQPMALPPSLLPSFCSDLSCFFPLVSQAHLNANTLQPSQIGEAAHRLVLMGIQGVFTDKRRAHSVFKAFRWCGPLRSVVRRELS